jgi:hypothetical protein
VFLSGGASIMPYTAQFFAEKLNVPVEYFNPFRNVQIDPSVNLEELAQVAHSLGEVVGLGLRNLANCPVEMNLMPDSTLRWRAFNEKKPYFLATVFLLALVAGAIGFLFQQLAARKLKASDDLGPKVAIIQDKVTKMKRANDLKERALAEANQITAMMEGRYYWGDVLSELRRVLIRSEDDVKKKYAVLYAEKFPTRTQGMEAGIWIEQFSMPGIAGSSAAYTSPSQVVNNPNMAAYLRTDASAATTAPVTNALTLVCRAVDLSGVDSGANNEIVYAVERELKLSPRFDTNSVQPSAQISAVDASGTFTFSITVAPQNPLKL